MGTSDSAKNVHLYVKKPVYVAAIIFKYSPLHIAELTEFCPDITNIRKDAHSTATGQATLNINYTIAMQIQLVEGDYIVKTASGEFTVMKPDAFNAKYVIV